MYNMPLDHPLFPGPENPLILCEGPKRHSNGNPSQFYHLAGDRRKSSKLRISTAITLPGRDEMRDQPAKTGIHFEPHHNGQRAVKGPGNPDPRGTFRDPAGSASFWSGTRRSFRASTCSGGPAPNTANRCSCAAIPWPRFQKPDYNAGARRKPVPIGRSYSSRRTPSDKTGSPLRDHGSPTALQAALVCGHPVLGRAALSPLEIPYQERPGGHSASCHARHCYDRPRVVGSSLV